MDCFRPASVACQELTLLAGCVEEGSSTSEDESARHVTEAFPPRTIRGPVLYLSDPQPLAPNDRLQRTPGMPGEGATPLSMATADLDGDGIEDLVVGYAGSTGGSIVLHRGNIDAFAPQSEASFRALGRENFPSPFLETAQVLSVAVKPDFIVAGHFTGDDGSDIAFASRGDSAVYVVHDDGAGGFGAPQKFAVPGGVTALVAGSFGNSSASNTLLVGTQANYNSFAISVLNGSADGLKLRSSLSVKAAVSDIQITRFGDYSEDAVYLAGGQLFILRSSTMQIVRPSLPSNIRSFALGSFIFDRTGSTQIAILRPNGDVQIAARREFDPRSYTKREFLSMREANVLHRTPQVKPLKSFPAAWKIVENFPAIGDLPADQVPVIFRTRVSSNGADDIMWLNAGEGKMAVISHRDAGAGQKRFAPGQVAIRPYAGSPVKAISPRLNIDGRPGVLAIHEGETSLSMMMPLPDPTFFVNKTTDPVPTSPITNACNNVSNADLSSSCSLREAVLRANALAGTDTIQLAAGTYSLTRGRIASPAYDAVSGTLNINDSVNIVGTVDGSGNPTSTITWGTLTSGNSVDMIMAINEDISILSNATASISNVVMQNGVNHGTHGNDGDGGCMEYDTGTSGNANLTLTNVTLQNCSTLQGGGGGLVAFNFLNHNHSGFLTITNSTIQNNSVVDNPSSGPGGGIALSNDVHMLMTNTKVLNNKATQVIGGQKGQGGGIMIFFPNGNFTGTTKTTIHSSTITGNKAAGFGGGIQSQSDILIDQGTVISNNVAGTDGTNPVAAQDGGGLYLNTFATGCPAACTFQSSISHATITGNTATGNGGGIATGNAGAFPAAGSLSVTFSRLAGNSVTGLGNVFQNGGTTVSATNDWWGTNAPATTINTIGGGSTTFDPFIVLTQNASPSKIRINQSTTMTGDIGHDNHGTAIAAANLDRIIGLPITFNNPLLGTIPQAQPETLNASAQATATFNAGAGPGRGSANATVDQAVIGANSNFIASASEAGTTVTLTTVGTHNFSVNNTVVITGVGVAGYNGTFTILSTPTPTTFTYTAGASGLAASSGGTANMGIIILSPPQTTKTFGVSTIPINGTTTASFSINNPNVVAINESFTDTLPTGLQVAGTPGVTNTCGGTVTATAGTGTISFSNSLAPIGTCAISVNITGTVDNNYTNSVQILSTDAGNGNTSSANLTVINPPHIVKAFGAATIPLNGTTGLTFTIDSNSNQNLTTNGAGFTDTLPAGLVVATPPNIGGTCTGTATAVAGASSVSLSGQGLTPNASCTVSIDVKGTTAGVKNNNVLATSTNAGTGNTGNASIIVVAPPTIAKAFGASSIAVNASTSLTFTLTNPNTTVALSGVAFSDTLPAGLVISTPNGLTGSCGSGTITATAGTGAISLSGGTIAASGNCSFAVNVTGTSPGLKNNTTGSVTSTNGGTGSTASASTTINKANTMASITSDTPDPSVIGQPVAVNFHVSSATGSSPTAPTGNVTVTDGTNNCTGSINASGDGSCNITFPTIGSKSLTATYAGDTNFNASPASASAPHTVNTGDVTIVVASDHNPSITGQTVTFTATIGATSPAVGTPTGTIQFKDGAANIGAAQSIVGGMAIISTSTLTAGTHTITAQYNGDTGFNTGTGTLAGGQVVSDAAEWTGSADSDWNNPANWSTGVVPASSNSADIPSVGVTNNPVIGGVTDITIVDLTIGSGRSLTINNSRTLTINGVLAMNGNDIDDTAGLLSISDTGSITRTSGIVLGTLQKAFSAPQVFTYPVGTTGAFSPVDVNATNGPGLLSVLAHTGTAPATPPLDPTKMLQRYWTLNGSGITADITFHYLDPDVPATSTESQYRVFRIITGGIALGFQPDGTNVILDTAANTFKVVSVKNFSDWTAGNPFAPTAAPVSISGRVMTADGRPVYQARVLLTDDSGNTVTVLTSPFGFYHFDGIPAGQTYVISATSKQHRFAAQVVTANDEIDDLDLVAEPQGESEF